MQSVKAFFKKHVRMLPSPQTYLVHLPAFPKELKASHPRLYESTFPLSEPVPCRLPIQQLMALDATYTCRSGGAPVLDTSSRCSQVREGSIDFGIKAILDQMMALQEYQSMTLRMAQPSQAPRCLAALSQPAQLALQGSSDQLAPPTPRHMLRATSVDSLANPVQQPALAWPASQEPTLASDSAGSQGGGRTEIIPASSVPPMLVVKVEDDDENEDEDGVGLGRRIPDAASTPARRTTDAARGRPHQSEDSATHQRGGSLAGHILDEFVTLTAAKKMSQKMPQREPSTTAKKETKPKLKIVAVARKKPQGAPKREIATSSPSASQHPSKKPKNRHPASVNHERSRNQFLVRPGQFNGKSHAFKYTPGDDADMGRAKALADAKLEELQQESSQPAPHDVVAQEEEEFKKKAKALAAVRLQQLVAQC